MSKAKKWFVIINPTSGNGSSKKKWARIKSLLEDYNLELEIVVVQDYITPNQFLDSKDVDANYFNIFRTSMIR